ncbi:MAG: M24 family metallopeptidase [Anaerolineae bacterium]
MSVGTKEEILGDVLEKERRVRAFLDKEGLDALALTRRDNFAWFTCGGDNHVVTTSEEGFTTLVITRDKKYAVAYIMDGPRVMDEEISGQGFELVSLRWYEGSLAEKVLELTRGMKVGADTPLAGCRFYTSELVDLHYPLTELELRRCRWIGARCAEILQRVAHWVEPGMTEVEIGARILEEYGRLGMTIDVLIIGTDERVAKYRHPMPTEKRLERYVILHPAARKWGLHANITRSVHFGPPPEGILRAYRAAATIEANIIGRLAPGLLFSEILALEKRLYADLGYPEEWRNHFQGGIIGYILIDPTRCLKEGEAVRRNQAFDWFITITGAKVEELSMVTDEGPEIPSLGTWWPRLAFEVEGREIEVPDILVR